MKAYLITTGSIFTILTLLHFWRIIAEWHSPDRIFLVTMAAMTILTAILAAWAFQLLRMQPRRDLTKFDLIRK